MYAGASVRARSVAFGLPTSSCSRARRLRSSSTAAFCASRSAFSSFHSARASSPMGRSAHSSSSSARRMSISAMRASRSSMERGSITSVPAIARPLQSDDLVGYGEIPVGGLPDALRVAGDRLGFASPSGLFRLGGSLNGLRLAGLGPCVDDVEQLGEAVGDLLGERPARILIEDRKVALDAARVQAELGYHTSQSYLARVEHASNPDAGLLVGGEHDRAELEQLNLADLTGHRLTVGEHVRQLVGRDPLAGGVQPVVAHHAELEAHAADGATLDRLADRLYQLVVEQSGPHEQAVVVLVQLLDSADRRRPGALVVAVVELHHRRALGQRLAERTAADHLVELALE